MTNKTYVWAFPTRIFHWILVAFIILSYITAQYKGMLIYHVAFSIGILLLILFRVIFGLFKIKYSRLKDFLYSFKDIKNHLFHIRKSSETYVGHNPLASLVISSLMLTILLTIISGFIHYGIEEGRGIFSSLNPKFYFRMELSGIIHMILSYLVLTLISIHIMGVLLDKVLHKYKSSFSSIFNGYKNVSGESVKLNKYHITYSYLWISLSVFLVAYIIFIPKNIFIADPNKEISYKNENLSFYKECISCHTLYPPFLLPEKSWILLMKQLDNHFGSDASIDSETEKSITDYLIANSAEKSTKESAYKILKYLQNDTTIAISKTPFWESTHKRLGEGIFKSDDVKSKANCIICHNDIEKGKIENENIGFYPQNRNKLISQQ